MAKIRFVLSRSAGRGRAHRLVDAIRRVYPNATHTRVGSSREAAGDVTISMTYGPADVAQLAREWREWHGADGVVYVAGGDGSVSETASALAGSECAFGVIPMGSGNDFARGLYNGDVGERAALALVAGTVAPQVRPIDLLQVNDVTCVNVFSLGYDTRILRNAMRVGRAVPFAGSLAYPIAVVGAVGMRKRDFVRVLGTDVGGEKFRIEQDVTVCAVGNGRFYGGGYQPLPEAKIDDGVADFLYSEPVGLMGFAAVIGKYRGGSHVGDRRVHMRRVRSLVIEGERELLWNVDGQIHESSRIAIHVLPGAVRLALPTPDRS
ncbi:YegS/Rv2252/BmrU family lipid kinase [Arcanobacterium wilhelmae]|uniref:YegS/Rv2252/BmrU family lipid kinase n=1 Tax=Arcanobacterium wilhelmae TaxID=1803177 RepID=A0ABT9ND53_9ACTO|nr:diacylglycerol kinase family protein [Arcanobacterium wilhelmae]MDP9801652.1 YegS/Rv2252/BmrU family lipid kinase [Arcanobacterium wilhelmae]